MELGYGNDGRKREFDSRKRDLKLERNRKRKRELDNEREVRYVFNLDLSLEDELVRLDLDSTSDEDSIPLEGNSRCVDVSTISSAPEGRRVKKSSKGKTEIIKLRCTLYEKKLLKEISKNCGLTISEYFRRIAFQKEIKERLSDEEIELYKMLVQYHNNFKSIGNMFKKKNPKLTEEVYNLALDIKEHLKKFDK